MPIFVVDPVGTLLFYNEPAEPILGKRFEETGEMPMSEWLTSFEPTDEGGMPLAPTEDPLAIALAEQSLQHALAFATLAGVKHLVPFHHDPAHADADLDRLIAEAVHRAQPSFAVTPGTEGATFELLAPTAHGGTEGCS